MTYFLSAWIFDGSISTVETDTMPILENHLPDLEHNFRVVAEVSGNFQEAIQVLQSISWNGFELQGIDFVNQHVISNTETQ